MVKHVMQDLIKTGKVSRGFLGAGIQGIRNEDEAQAFHVPDTAGAIVEDVTPGGPAEKAGLKNGDVIRKLDGQQIADAGQLIAAITNINPGTQVTVDILRDGKPMTVKVTLGERPANLSASNAPGARGGGPSSGALRGMSVQNLTPSVRDQLGLPAPLGAVPAQHGTRELHACVPADEQCLAVDDDGA